jgi:hypothetical protein
VAIGSGNATTPTVSGGDAGSNPGATVTAANIPMNALAGNFNVGFGGRQSLTLSSPNNGATLSTGTVNMLPGGSEVGPIGGPIEFMSGAGGASGGVTLSPATVNMLPGDSQVSPYGGPIQFMSEGSGGTPAQVAVTGASANSLPGGAAVGPVGAPVAIVRGGRAG